MVKEQAPRAAVLGCAGLTLTDTEKSFFETTDPLGFILFKRNCETPDQVRALVKELRGCIGRADAPVLIDQEGGRVVRLGPPHWRLPPAATRFAEIAISDRQRAGEAARLNARMMAHELTELGINVDCTPVLDLPQPGADPIIGDRAYGTDPILIATLARHVCDGLLAGGVLPIIKHIPGHGRAMVDSHMDLPVVETAPEELSQTDFAPFAELADMPWAMTAHVIYTAIDDVRPATLSPAVIDEVIRRGIGFSGVLLSDDLSMNALSGDMRSRAEDALAAGCDVVLHCNAEMDEMEAVMAGTRSLSDPSLERLARSFNQIDSGDSPEMFDFDAASAQLDALMALKE